MENSAYKESSAPPCQVDELLAALRQIKRHPKGYRGLHVHFSLLDRQHQQPSHRRLIATAFNKLVQAKDGQLFWTRHFDLVFLCKDASNAELDIALLAARRAVEDSPILKGYKDAGRDDDLCDWYELDLDFDRFAAKVADLKEPDDTSVSLPDTPSKSAPPEDAAKAPSLKSMIKDLNKKLTSEQAPKAEQKPAAQTTRPLYDPIALKKPTIPPMGPTQLDQLERTLVNIEMDRLLASQTAYVVAGEAPPQPIFVEHFVSVKEVSNTLLPNYDMHSDKWLFQRLTRSFDKKLLQALPHKAVISDQVVSLNINVDTVFTPEFDKFMSAFKTINPQPLILEMRLFDVLSDMRHYITAREKLTRLGCRISLDAIDIESLTVLDRELLSVDFLKIYWRKDYRNMLRSPAQDKITRAIENHGAMRIVLCHCDTAQALDFGKAIGIHMYQGFWIDQKYHPAST